MVYGQVPAEDFFTCSSICKQMRHEGAPLLLRRSRLRLCCRNEGDQSWTVHFSSKVSERADGNDFFEADAPPMSWDTFQDSYMAKFLDEFSLLTLTSSICSVRYGDSEVTLCATKMRNGEIRAHMCAWDSKALYNQKLNLTVGTQGHAVLRKGRDSAGLLNTLADVFFFTENRVGQRLP